MQICGVVSNILDQLYYPLEHVAWASDKKLLSVRSDKWWTLSTICWVLSVYFCLIKSLRYLSVIRKHKSKLEVERNVGIELAMASRLQLNEILTALRCTSDLIYAIHWLPSGILWSGKLSDLQVGALGTFSSIISLVQSFYSVTNISME
uniref:Peroxisomal membrane protein 11C n=1 Tax=Clastoptera arizonana TaxID=38151 RepID=A0A1B6CRJ8_9HEMI